MSAANNFGTSQWFLTLCSLSEGDQSRHIWEKKGNKIQRMSEIVRFKGKKGGKINNRTFNTLNNLAQNDRQLFLTLFCNLNLTSAKFGLFDVLDTEIAAALGVDLGSVPR